MLAEVTDSGGTVLLYHEPARWQQRVIGGLAEYVSSLALPHC